MERWAREMTRRDCAPPDDIAVVLATEGRHGPVVYAANRAARGAGVITGERIVDMRAICPDLRVEYAGVAGDLRALERLKLWVRRWCPWTVVDGSDGLILETTGADHLVGGEAAMLVDMQTRLSLMGLTAQPAVAPTWGAAWALARYGPVRARCEEGGVAEALAPLPVAALRLDDATILLLHRLGLKTIGALAKAPRLALTRRFARAALSANPLMRLDQAMGGMGEPVSSTGAPPPMRADARLPEPIQDPSAHLPALCEDLCAKLSDQGMGCRTLCLSVYHTDGEISVIEVATAAPSRDPTHLLRLFDDRLERINPGFGFDLIRLEAGTTEPFQTVQTRLDGDSSGDLALPRLIDRLTARLGADAVTTPRIRSSHMPERGEVWVRALEAAGPIIDMPQKDRPIRLLRSPEEVRVVYAVPEGPPAQFIWRRQTRRVARYQGPERIAPEWWRDRPSTRLRDYFKVEDSTGLRLWLYREGLHDDGRGGDPRWFVHGMFA
jgi:protein ImuB